MLAKVNTYPGVSGCLLTPSKLLIIKYTWNNVILYLGAPTSTTSTKQESNILPRPFDDDQSESSELSSEEENPRERIGFDFS